MQIRVTLRTVPVVLALAVALAVACAGQGNPVVEWVRAHAIALKTAEAGHGFADMQPLKKVVGKARIVALGEATHGTREFFQLKHRMVEFLASEMGFTIFSIEANMPEAYRLNDFVLTGKGDPAGLLKGMYFWTWNTQEVLDMILWMREFNKSGKGRIEFTGFDMQTPTVAMEIVGDFVKKAEPEYAEALQLIYDEGRAAWKSRGSGSAGFGVATTTFPVELAAGKRVRYSGWIKTEAITRGYAGLWWRVDGDEGKVLAFDNMRDRGPKGTTPWTRYEIVLEVPANATNINFGVIHPGDGTAWFDSLAVELDGAPSTDKAPADLDFESASTQGFYTGGAGYRVELDKETAHTGKQSLRSKFVGGDQPAEKQKAVDPRAAAAKCSEVVEHLEKSRQAYEKKGATPKEIGWATQNARVVVQCMQSLAGQVSRDRSMAENVKWILDQAPGAKIVLWAHNGHVAAGGPRGYQPMGKYLREMYGGEMVVFGFAFNQGSFQAVEQGKALRDFTVSPAPEESLDAMLAAAGIPLLAIDLRLVPATGPVGDWLRAARKTRSIGAVFQEGPPDAYMMNLKAPESFDALLFVEKTTAARKNPPWAGTR